jgi:hypothetical protein
MYCLVVSVRRRRIGGTHERFLELAERCRDFESTSEYTGLLRDVQGVEVRLLKKK